MKNEYNPDNDLFNDYDNLSGPIKDILDEYSEKDQTYQNCENLLAECEAIGYTFDFYLDAVPFNLRKL